MQKPGILKCSGGWIHKQKLEHLFCIQQCINEATTTLRLRMVVSILSNLQTNLATSEIGVKTSWLLSHLPCQILWPLKSNISRLWLSAPLARPTASFMRSYIIDNCNSTSHHFTCGSASAFTSRLDSSQLQHDCNKDSKSFGASGGCLSGRKSLRLPCLLISGHSI